MSCLECCIGSPSTILCDYVQLSVDEIVAGQNLSVLLLHVGKCNTKSSMMFNNSQMQASSSVVHEVFDVAFRTPSRAVLIALMFLPVL